MNRAPAELDPLSLVIGTDLAMALVFAWDNDKTSAELRKVLELDASFTLAHYLLVGFMSSEASSKTL